MEKVLFNEKETGFKVTTFEKYSNKPMIVIFPGGGYHHLSERESMPVVNKFLSFGYNVTLVHYSVAPLADFIQLKQANRVIEDLSKTYKDIVVMGFSAGGHLAGITATQENVFNIKAMILCYPVISFINYVHQGTVSNFLANGNDTIENRHLYSVNERVNSKTVPCYIWATKTDASVPYENTLMMIDALKENGIYHEYYIFPKGPHGMALADSTAIKDGDTSCVNEEVATWVNKVNDFIQKVIN